MPAEFTFSGKCRPASLRGMNFGIIGTGTIGRFHAEAIRAMEGGTLHSVFNRSGTTSLAEFLADPELEIVTIATPSGAHLEPVLAALAVVLADPGAPVDLVDEPVQDDQQHDDGEEAGDL